VHPDDKEPSLAQWAHCVESGQNYECEYRLRGQDGQYRWFRARAVPIRDNANKVIRWYGTCSDIHDSKLVEHAMRESAVELEKKVDERTAALRRLSNRLMTMQDDERRRIARELHDGLGQEMVALKMLLNGIAHSPRSLPDYIGDATSVIDRATQQIRTLSYLLHPPLLDEVGLLSALRWYLEGLTQRSGIETKLEVSPTDFPRLALEVETAMFRIIQEALTNVFRHSGARQAWISLTQREGTVSVKVRDDGKGVSDGIVELRSGTPGVGIRGMSERAKELGGQLLVARAHPGTIVEVTIPVPASVTSLPERPEEKVTVSGTNGNPVVGRASVGQRL
jgi:signal transduction histidine kinase